MQDIVDAEKPPSFDSEPDKPHLAAQGSTLCVAVSPASAAQPDFRRRFFPQATDQEWNDWRWQSKNSIKNKHDFSRVFDLTRDERLALEHGNLRLPARVTPYYAGLFSENGACSLLRRTMVPCLGELEEFNGQRIDPLGEDHDSPVPGLVHRYPDRALLLATETCFAYCRYCTRSRRVGGKDSRGRNLDQAIAYLAAHREIRDVIISGGDPLTLSDNALDSLLTRLRAIKHIEILRIGTKAPMVLPQRVTPELVAMLKKHQPLYISVHCTHPDELTPECARALNMLADGGFPLGSQTVLLTGVNDQPETMKRLFHGLLKARVRPYYLYQCDPVVGTGHFRTTVAKGIEIIESLRGHTSGYAIPQFVIDLPGGGGKIPVLPEYLVKRAEGVLTFRNYEGKTFTVHEKQPAASHTATTVPEQEVLQ